MDKALAGVGVVASGGGVWFAANHALQASGPFHAGMYVVAFLMFVASLSLCVIALLSGEGGPRG